MISIGTNIFNKLSASNKEIIQDEAKKIFALETLALREYKEKSVEESGNVKYFLGDIPLKEILEDLERWNQFARFLGRIISLSAEDLGELRECQFWITSLDNPVPINIFFSAKKEAEVIDRFVYLRDTLVVTDVFNSSEEKPGTIVIVGYDIENSTWRISRI